MKPESFLNHFLLDRIPDQPLPHGGKAVSSVSPALFVTNDRAAYLWFDSLRSVNGTPEFVGPLNK